MSKPSRCFDRGAPLTVTSDKAAELNRLLNELDVVAQGVEGGGSEPDEAEVRRRNTRYPFRTPCVVRYVPEGGASVRELPGRTRNVSGLGIGVVVRRVFQEGEPIEIEVKLPDRPSVYLGGVVTFCRYAGLAYHEDGIKLKTARRAPILVGGLEESLKEHEWLRTAMTATAGV